MAIRASGRSQPSMRPSTSCFAARSSTIVSSTRSASRRAASSIPEAATSRPASWAPASAASRARPGTRPQIVTVQPARTSAAASPGAMRPLPSTTARATPCGCEGSASGTARAYSATRAMTRKESDDGGSANSGFRQPSGVSR